jgi:hypothetical protein
LVVLLDYSDVIEMKGLVADLALLTLLLLVASIVWKYLIRPVLLR